MSTVALPTPIPGAKRSIGKGLGLRVGRRAISVLLTAAASFATVIALSITAPTLLGHNSLVVLSGSMAPTLRVGDVVVEKRIAPLDARIGDVVTFRSPDHHDRLYTHRVVGMEATAGHVRFVTRGDANTGVEHWTIDEHGVIGRVEYRVPKVGYITNLFGSRFGRFFLIVIPALAFGLFELRRIWRRAD